MQQITSKFSDITNKLLLFHGFYVAFSIQLLPLSITFSRFIHVIHMNPYSIVFLWPKKLHGMDIPLSFIHTSVNRHSFKVAFSSVKFSRSLVSDSLQPHELQHARPPCPSSTPGVYSNSCPSSQWCHPAISSSVVPFSSCPQSLPASRSFQVSQFFTSGGQSIGISASASALPTNIQYWFPLGLTGWISLQSARLVAINLWFKKKSIKFVHRKWVLYQREIAENQMLSDSVQSFYFWFL